MALPGWGVEGSIIDDCRSKELTRVFRKMEEFIFYGFTFDSPLLVIKLGQL